MLFEIIHAAVAAMGRWLAGLLYILMTIELFLLIFPARRLVKRLTAIDALQTLTDKDDLARASQGSLHIAVQRLLETQCVVKRNMMFTWTKRNRGGRPCVLSSWASSSQYIAQSRGFQRRLYSQCSHLQHLSCCTGSRSTLFLFARALSL